MIIKASNLATSRRQFLLNVLPGGTLLCLGCNSLLALAKAGNKQQANAEKHKFLADSEMSFEEVYNFAFRYFSIPIMQELAQAIGRDKFLDMLKKASSDAFAKRQKEAAKYISKNDLATFTYTIKNPNRRFKHTLTSEIIEYTDEAVEVKYTECLYAKTFREADAPDIGYALVCHTDFAIVRAFNPKIKLIRTKTLMQGHDCCDFRWVLEE